MSTPSVSNTAGTLAGLASLLTSSTIVNAVAGSGPLLAIAAATGIPGVIFSTAILGVGSMLVNYSVTHWAEARVLEDRVDGWLPLIKAVFSVKTYAEYPQEGGNFPPVTTNINKG